MAVSGAGVVGSVGSSATGLAMVASAAITVLTGAAGSGGESRLALSLCPESSERGPQDISHML